MASEAGVFGPRTQLGFWMVMVLMFGAGVAAAVTPGVRPYIEPYIKPALALVMLMAGLILLSSWVWARSADTTPDLDEQQRKARRRLRVGGLGSVLWGSAMLMPSGPLSTTLMIVVAILMGGAAAGFPKRLFAPVTSGRE